ncbi:hypothetical protein BGZ80_010314 [Entomortierella chlamydospora]|uniref:Uncharacterized protein n=1 Tax=Entomortierella chlamydospora TaxID=101097 RepID=A0A9P6SZV1_9FUNG|nr:hypothetical protein BGZ80_010314 [Entomortierella chlamydospora]
MISHFPLPSLRSTFRYARGLHTKTNVAPFNIAFDIDGVLIKINGENMIVSHSPMRALVPLYKDSNVLVVGGEGSSCKYVAQSYGFKRVVTPEEVHSVYPSVCPTSTCHARPDFQRKEHQNLEEPIDAVMVFHDSVDWGRDLQLCLDALASKGGVLGTIKESADLHSTKQSVPIYFSNPDIVWSNDYPVPRFGQGTFRICLENIYKVKSLTTKRGLNHTRQSLKRNPFWSNVRFAFTQALTSQDLEYTTFGKPMANTYKYADKLLDRIAPLPSGPNGQASKRAVYAVGDNPYSDIAGANAHGWDSVLVKTGVFRSKGLENHAVHPATAVVENVEDAVRWIIAKEKMKLQG